MVTRSQLRHVLLKSMYLVCAGALAGACASARGPSAGRRTSSASAGNTIVSNIYGTASAGVSPRNDPACGLVTEQAIDEKLRLRLAGPFRPTARRVDVTCSYVSESGAYFISFSIYRNIPIPEFRSGRFIGPLQHFTLMPMTSDKTDTTRVWIFPGREVVVALREKYSTTITVTVLALKAGSHVISVLPSALSLAQAIQKDGARPSK